VDCFILSICGVTNVQSWPVFWTSGTQVPKEISGQGHFSPARDVGYFYPRPIVVIQEVYYCNTGNVSKIKFGL